MSYNCKRCNRIFEVSGEYEKHISGCEFFFDFQKMTNTPLLKADFMPEKIPRTLKELYIMMVNDRNNDKKERLLLTKKIDILEKKMSVLTSDNIRLKANSGIKCRKYIDDEINCNEVPNITYQEWILSIVVDDYYLNRVLTENLSEGMFACIFDRIIKDGVSNIPIRAFRQKPNIIYIVSKSTEGECKNKWITSVAGDMMMIINVIRNKILTKFCEWNAKNPPTNKRSEREMNSELYRWEKIYDKTSTERLMREFNKRFKERFAKDIVDIDT